MEEVEEANKAAVESCHGVLSRMCQPTGQYVHCNPLLAEETAEAVLKFKGVVGHLSSTSGCLGHARVRKLNKCFQPPPLLPQTMLLDGPSYRCNRSDVPTKKPLRPLLPATCDMIINRRKVLLGKADLDLDMNIKPPPLHVANPRPLLPYQPQYGINDLAFDRFSCRSFMPSCLSMDGGVANTHTNSFQLLAGVPQLPHQSLRQQRRCIGVANAHSNSFQILPLGVPLPSNQSSKQQRRCSGVGGKGNVKCGSSGRCHRPKKTKMRMRRSFIVPAIGNKISDIPADAFSWRKYGQKPIKGSPYPRGYYKCSSARGCPAKKHVERCLEHPAMLIVTYEGEHKHSQSAE